RGPDNAAKDEVVALAGELGLTGVSVEFPNAVLESEMIAAAAQADVGIIPYLPHWAGYRFACPNKLSQYMLAGTAILTNQLDFVVETVEHYDCGLSYDADRAQSIVAAVDRLIDDADLLDRCREHSRSAAHADFHWEKQSRPLYEAYEALTKQA
ncbi:MAG: glycosyltransferase, partial [Planctomycetota bacterium]